MSRIVEAIANRFDALTMKGTNGSIHTNKGEIGQLARTSVFKGTATILVRGQEVTLPARQVGELDTILPNIDDIMTLPSDILPKSFHRDLEVPPNGAPPPIAPGEDQDSLKAYFKSKLAQ